MPTARKRIAVSLERETPPIEDYRAKPAQEIFGKLVFNDAAQKQYLSKDVYKKLRATALRGQPLDPSIADQVAQGMREWALAHGASHYTHWFVPMTGLTAEKHDAFIEPSIEGGAITEFVGKTLVRGEPDASSFPSGGTRATFEARGYTVWDPQSPAFIQEEVNGATLTIPTAFVSYTAEALDQKTPLLRSVEALSTQAVRLLRLFGNKSVTRVYTTLGPEQEYFLIDRKYYELRPDLIACGRTLFGAPPYRGQELEDHYFGAIRERILAFMMDLDRELWKRGVPAKTRHNEVAPAQFELAPVFERTSLSADHNMVVMELMRRTALRHDLVCLLHEKPFAGINGSGKHNNWSMSTDAGENLLDPGNTPHANAQFLAFLVATISAVDEYAALLRIAVSGPGNDHRLGANEAPPAILSVYLGEQLEDIINQLETGTPTKSLGGGVMELGVTTMPVFPKDATDRNRTSPFAFTGNKFEFRAVGSSQSCYLANTILNTIVAESVKQLADELEKAAAGDFNRALADALRARIKAHKKVLFSGNNYSADWHAEAARRGLPNLKDTVESLKAAHNKSFEGVFDSHKVMSPKEYEARIEIFWERYVKILNIEATATSDISRNQILPAAIDYQARIAGSIVALKNAGVDVPSAQMDLLKLVANAAANLKTASDALDAAIEGASGADLKLQGEAYRDRVVPAMNEVRKIADGLEAVVDDNLWPLPKYREMLFQY
ncbi:MAG TPA: glutamine synthetase III [Polyangiaceae bacterium]|nr:glutamine synthetase III [Polyangiaceae bacterium]